MSRKLHTPRAPAPDKPYDCLYQLKIHLLHISPQIYRRIIVKGDTTILQLHHIVQIVMGWDIWQLHNFRIFGRDYGIDYPGGEQFLGIPEITRLGDFCLQFPDTFHYVYDYFDHWVHQIRVEAITSAQETYLHPVCMAGKRACPPQELGGPTVYDQRMQQQREWAYEWLDTVVERIKAGENPLEDDVPRWYYTYDSEKFDRPLVNRKLAQLYQIKGGADFWYAKGGYEACFKDLHP